MSYLGRIITLPDINGSSYGMVRDEYGTNRIVEPAELPKGAHEGDKFAYRVEFSKQTGDVALKNEGE